ncbi:MAG: thioredoxin family protein [Microthrixaceae bacterium]
MVSFWSDLWAEWCGPYKAFAPVFEEVSEAHPDATFAKIDTRPNRVWRPHWGIMSIPTLMVFRDGVLCSTSQVPCPDRPSRISAPGRRAWTWLRSARRWRPAES